jgi:hypothetical protein
MIRAVWVAFRFELVNRVSQARYWLSIAALPALLVFVVGSNMLAARLSYDSRPIGILDLAGVEQWDFGPGISADRPQEYRVFQDDDEALAAFEAGALQAIVIVPAGFPVDTALGYRADAPLPPGTVTRIQEVIRATMTLNMSPLARQALEAEIGLAEWDPKIGETNLIGARQVWSFILPILAGIALLLAVNGNAGRYTDLVGAERETRLMEVLLSSTNLSLVVLGKVLGLSFGVLLQLAVWLGAAVGLFAWLLQSAGLSSVLAAGFPTDTLWHLAALFIASLAFWGSLFTYLGARIKDPEIAQQVASAISFVVVLSLPLIYLAGREPDALATWVAGWTPPLAFQVAAGRMMVRSPQLLENGPAIILLLATSLCSVGAARALRRAADTLSGGQMPRWMWKKGRR